MLEKNKLRAKRRRHERRVQGKRAQILEKSWYSDIKTYANYYGQLKHRHFGCGCTMCKPWKHKIAPKYSPSERRRLD